MSTKIKGEKIKDRSIALTSIILGDALLELFEADNFLLSISENNVYYNLPFPLSQNVLYCEANNYYNIIELRKGDTVKLSHGPLAHLTWDDNGIKIDASSVYYNVKVHSNITKFTPDWNAEESKPGYIKNRTHYTEIEDYTIINDADIDSTYTFIFQSNYALFYKKENGSTYKVELPIASDKIDNVKDNDWVYIDAYGPPLQAVRTLEGVFIRNNTGYVANRNLYFWKELVHTLNEKYIPDIIARKSDITPDWNVSASEVGYIKNKTHGLKGKYTDTLGKGITKISYSSIYKFAYFTNTTNSPIIISLPAFEEGWKSDTYYSSAYIKYTYEDNAKFIELIDPDNKFNNTTIEFFSTVERINGIYISSEIARTKDYELPHITFYQSKKTDNLTLLSSLTSNYHYTCDLYTGIKNNKYAILENGEYYNGIITGINKGKLVQYDVNFETGAITQKLNIDLELIGSEVKLDVCTAGSEEAARNLELLNAAYFSLGDHFTVNIDAGIGVAKFIPETGGEGHITTASGVNVHYNIGADGSVIKTMEIDIVELYNKVNSL